ncbi:MAG: Crp/Fnr family transcriptional regulator [Magnetococcales bacterium]|nr:Crp/Fnr family transcriptional regulator [Magnetococcales bacterium]
MEERDKNTLKRISLFAALTPIQLAGVESKMMVMKLNKNQTIFDTETRAERFFVLTDGQVKLYRLSKSGTEKIVEIIQPGEVFASGVIFMESKRYPVCADTMQTSRILSFENKQFLGLLRESSDTCFRMMAHMSKQLRWQMTEIHKLSLQSAPMRLIGFLLENMKPFGENEGVIKLDAPKNVIASRIAIKPETFSRALKKLSKENLITVQGQSIHINNVEELTWISSI